VKIDDEVLEFTRYETSEESDAVGDFVRTSIADEDRPVSKGGENRMRTLEEKYRPKNYKKELKPFKHKEELLALERHIFEEKHRRIMHFITKQGNYKEVDLFGKGYQPKSPLSEKSRMAEKKQEVVDKL